MENQIKSGKGKLTDRSVINELQKLREENDK